MRLSRAPRQPQLKQSLPAPYKFLPFDRQIMAPADISFVSEKRTRRQTNVSAITRFSLTTTLTRAPGCPSFWTRARPRVSPPCPQLPRALPRPTSSPPGTSGPAARRSENRHIWVGSITKGRGLAAMRRAIHHHFARELLTQLLRDSPVAGLISENRKHPAIDRVKARFRVNASAAAQVISGRRGKPP